MSALAWVNYSTEGKAVSEWYEVHNPTRFLVVVAVALAAGFGGGWIVNNEVHGDDVCDFAREGFESVMNQPEDTPYTARLEGHVLARYVIACGNEDDIQALKDEYFIP